LLSGFFELAETCFKKSEDFNSLLLFYSSYGDEEGLKYLLNISEEKGKYNIAFESAYLLALPERCVTVLIKSKRYSEAAMFAKSYIPTMIPIVMKEWSEVLKQNELPFIPENIFESSSHKEIMINATKIF
jgi:coatomer subunit beta'